jgi:hypothetical protein
MHAGPHSDQVGLSYFSLHLPNLSISDTIFANAPRGFLKNLIFPYVPFLRSQKLL